ncbi:hypothetical protein PCURB6_28000 [Paenibacillus curdlanolyticus]|nr:hypothetical protein PCURB6_28000 [Paenibacillus curdlanolyticus]
MDGLKAKYMNGKILYKLPRLKGWYELHEVQELKDVLIEYKRI